MSSFIQENFVAVCLAVLGLNGLLIIGLGSVGKWFASRRNRRAAK